MRHVLLLALACVGCGKELNSKFCNAHPDDERCSTESVDSGTIDSPNSRFPVAHLGYATELMLTSDVDVTLGVATVFDTTAGTITPEVPGAVVLASVPQDDGPPVMVVQVGSLDITVEAYVVGNKPLVLVAARTIYLHARIDVSAARAVPGAGGALPGMGPGAGSVGMHSTVNYDGGGGGASYGTLGGRGGNPLGGLAGATYGSAMRLQGGSGGGTPSRPGTCAVGGGGGGGAVQLTALVSITNDSRINAGGGGGDGGETCEIGGSGGGGGGSGGMIFLESPLLLGAGLLGANGGGGGEAATTGGGTAGAPGTDATTDLPGAGGASTNSGGDGGAGASGSTVGGQGQDVTTDGNGGGGGGGGGAIYYLTAGAEPSYTASPPAAIAP